jgi:glycosyltransferase involved in cell wall biosynthesis
MKTVLLLYPDMLFYKISIFNKLSIYLEERGYQLIIWYRHIHDPNAECRFKYVSNTPMTISNYIRVIKKNKIEFVINILFKREPGIFFYFFSLFAARFLEYFIIYYGHGIYKQKQWRNFLYNLTYFLFDGIILYTPAEKSKLWKIFHYKITCANNTLDITDLDICENKEQTRSYYNIKSTKIILTTGRLHSRKRIDILSDIFIQNYKNSTDVAWVIVGPDLNNDIKNAIKNINNIHYLGPIFKKGEMAKIFSMADIYCVPGILGLGINEALYWGLPVITMDINHGPEVYYLRNGYNSLFAKDKQALRLMIDDLVYNDEKRSIFSRNARKVFVEEATLDKMFEGFSLQLSRFSN